MTIPTALAPNVELATPKVKKHAEKIRHFLRGEIKDFYVADPSELYLENRQGEKWTEGSWGLVVLAPRFDLEWMMDLKNLSSTIEVSSIAFKPASATHIELSIWLTGRVMR